MTNRQTIAQREALRKLRRKGQFVHVDVQQGPQFDNGERMPPKVLEALRRRGKVETVQNDLLGEPMQFKAPAKPAGGR